MKSALIIVDMLKDTLEKHPETYLSKETMKFVPIINRLSALFRKKNRPVVFACDAFHPDDFIFTGKMKPHSIKGTQGAQIITEILSDPSDIILEKPRFSAFFKTNLEEDLKRSYVDHVVVCGIATNVCILTTALDAIASDFKTVLLSDCSASYLPGIHESVIKIFEKGPLFPLLRMMTSDDFIKEFIMTENN